MFLNCCISHSSLYNHLSIRKIYNQSTLSLWQGNYNVILQYYNNIVVTDYYVTLRYANQQDRTHECHLLSYSCICKTIKKSADDCLRGSVGRVDACRDELGPGGSQSQAALYQVRVRCNDADGVKQSSRAASYVVKGLVPQTTSYVQ